MFQHNKDKMYENITSLLPSNFVSTGQLNAPLNKGIVVVLYYATWCTYCSKMQDEYSKFSKILDDKKLGKAVVLDYDAVKTTIPDFFKNFPYIISGYPSIIFYNDGGPCSRYDGLRTSDGLLEFTKQFSSKNAMCTIK